MGFLLWLKFTSRLLLPKLECIRWMIHHLGVLVKGRFWFSQSVQWLEPLFLKKCKLEARRISFFLFKKMFLAMPYSMWDLSSPNQNSKSEWVLNAVLYPGLDPGTERRYYWKIGEIQIKSKVQWAVMSWYRPNSLSSSPLPSSYIEALTPSVGVSEMGPLRK